MKPLLLVGLSSLLLVAVACTSPVVPMAVPTVEPTIPSTLEHLPTATIKPTQRPSPTPPVIPVPYTIITPTRVVTLTVTEITGTISTRGKAAIVWLADGMRHFGILDIDKASVSQLLFSVEDNYKQFGFVKWSPTGTAFIYEQHILDYASIQHDSDIFGVTIDAQNKGKRLDKDLHYFNNCDWSPDGQYVICSFNATDRGIGGRCIRVYDLHAGDMVCGSKDQIFCQNFGDRSLDCKPLLLNTGELWDPVDADPYPYKLTSTPKPTEVIHNVGTVYILPGAKILNVTWSPLK